ncbi:SDR family NAD(P)-dependent oxidoreductase, partial [Kitasatospora sp. NPDC049285]|uniref:SDR family NAD(P)-dependent oxidoreductase n=1 Tax=Kitasatospora sp. NPDC049285 TaxID=3157096 RepID=UPI00342B6D42
LVEVSAADVGRLRSLRQIIDAFGSADAAPAADGAALSTGTSATPLPIGRPLTRHVVRAVPVEASGLRVGGLGQGRVAVTDDGTGVAQRIVDRFAELGIRASVVNRIPADVHGVVFLGGLRAVASVDEALAVNREAFRSAREFARRAGTGGDEAVSGWFVTVQDTGGDFGQGGADPTHAWLGGLAALARTARLEWPKAAVKAIDCERGDRDARAVADAVVDELLAGGPVGDVGLRADGSRVVLRMVELPASALEAGVVDDRSVIVATGGGRGVTAEVLRGLAGAHRPRIALVGRTALADLADDLPEAGDAAALGQALLARRARSGDAPPSPAELRAEVSAVLAGREVRATVDALRAAGSDVRYLAVDVREEKALAAALDDVRQAWGPITGILHGAGVLADRFLADKTDEDFDRVFDTKVGGLRALLAATEHDPLALLCMFSSVAARYGNPGQGDYAMANEVLSQVAGAYRAAHPDCLVRSIEWGPWRGGMVTTDLAEHFERNHVPLIPVESGTAAFLAELADTREVQVTLSAAGPDDGPALGAAEPDLLGEVHADSRTHPYLADHAIAGRPVLPLAMALEWFTGLARDLEPERRVHELHDVSVLSKVALDHLAGDGHRLLLRSTSDTAGRRIDLTAPSGRPHFRARVRPLGAATPQPAPAPVHPKATALTDGGYRYDGNVLFHGPMFRALTDLHEVSVEGARATVTGAHGLGWPGTGWNTDPAAVDGGLQVAVLWAERALGGATLPMAVGAFRVHRPGLLPSPARCEVTARKVGATEAVCDVRIIDADGVVRAELSGVTLVLRPDTTQASHPAGGE